MLKLTIKRTIKSGMLTGKKFDLLAKVEGDDDLQNLFKGYADEHVLAYKSNFVDRSISVKRNELLKGFRFSASSLNEVIEFEDGLKIALEHIKRMAGIVQESDAEVIIEA